MVSAALASTLVHSIAAYWVPWLLIVSVGLVRILVGLMDRRHASERAVRTYVRAAAGGDPPR